MPGAPRHGTARLRLKAVAFAGLLALLLPILLVQALHTRRTALRLPEAKGPQQGICPAPGPDPGADIASARPLRCLIIGESPVAGVGVTHQAQGIGPALAAPLARLLKRPLHWQCHGRNGLRLRDLLAAPLPGDLPDDLPDNLPANLPPDLILVMMGVNDTTGLTGLRTWRRQLTALIRLLCARTGLPPQALAFAPVPPMHRFSALPQPLRAVVGLRAHQLNETLRHTCLAEGCLLQDYGDLTEPAFLAEDGYHPSARGFQAMGERLATQLFPAIEKLPDLSQSEPVGGVQH